MPGVPRHDLRPHRPGNGCDPQIGIRDPLAGRFELRFDASQKLGPSLLSGRMPWSNRGSPEAGRNPPKTLTICINRRRCILMKSRVTITLDPEVHQLAKQSARKKNTTVSGLIETLIQAQATRINDGDLVAEMTGIASLRDPATGTDPLYDSLKAKYLRE